MVIDTRNTIHMNRVPASMMNIKVRCWLVHTFWWQQRSVMNVGFTMRKEILLRQL